MKRFMGRIIDVVQSRSALTSAQLQTFVLERSIRRGEITLSDAVKSRKPTRAKRDVQQGVTPGSHYRVLSQARRNVERSIFTLLLASKLQIIDPEGVTRLLSMVAAAPDEMVDEDLQKFAIALSTLVQRIVMV